MHHRIFGLAIVAALFATLSRSQQTSPGTLAPPGESKRLLGIIPNYRTSPSLANYHPLTAAEKFKMASEDSWDRGTFAMALLFGGEGQLTNSNRAFGQGGAGFGRYVGASYGDFVIGNYMTEEFSRLSFIRIPVISGAARAAAGPA